MGSPTRRIGSETLGQTVKGLARYPISVRYPREIRDIIDGLRKLPVLEPSQQQITLGTVAGIRVTDGPPILRSENERAVREGALLRVRPKAMAVAVILAGLFPILIGTGTGSEVMSRFAAPMIGGMLTSPLLSMLDLPAAYLPLRRPRKARRGANSV
jgi:Cu/Ag efflux pump CusA